MRSVITIVAEGGHAEIRAGIRAENYIHNMRQWINQEPDTEYEVITIEQNTGAKPCNIIFGTPFKNGLCGEGDRMERIDGIQGWMSEEELEFLARAVKDAGPDALIVELGAWKGRSTAVLYTTMHDNQTVITVDTWLGQSDIRFEAHREVLEEDIFLKFMENMKRFGIEPHWYNSENSGACYLRMDSCDAANLFGQNAVDILFIDCDHTRVGSDIDAWIPKVKPDGIICGHDYNWVGVKESVLKRIEITSIVADIWIADPIRFAGNGEGRAE